MDVRKAFLYFDPRVFVLVRLSTPSQTSLNRILCLSISTRYHPRKLNVYLFECFYVQLKCENLQNFHFYVDGSGIEVVSQCALCHGYKPCAKVFT